MQAPAPPIERLAAIIVWLAGSVAEQGSRKRHAGPLVVAIWTRLRRTSAQFLALAAAPIPPARPAPAAPDTAPRSPPQAARPPRCPPVMPYRVRWLLRRIPSTAASLAELEALVRDPKMEALLAANPRWRRPLRALCWMLGVPYPSLAPPPRRRRKHPAPATPPDAPRRGRATAPARAASPGARMARRARRKKV